MKPIFKIRDAIEKRPINSDDLKTQFSATSTSLITPFSHREKGFVAERNASIIDIEI